MMSEGRPGHAVSTSPAASAKCVVPMNGLFDNDLGATARAGRFARPPLPERPETFEVVEVLVPIERDEILPARFAPSRTPEPAGVEVRVRAPAQFHLEVSKSVRADGASRSCGRPSLTVFSSSAVDERIAQARRCGAPSSVERRRGNRSAGRARAPGSDRAQSEPIRDNTVERLTEEPAQAIEHRAFDQADAEVGKQRRHAGRVGPLALVKVRPARN